MGIKNKVGYIITAVIAVVLCTLVFAISITSVKSKTISFIPDEVTEFFYSYLDTCMNRPENAVDYVHFENEVEREAFKQSHIKIMDYEILGVQKVNDNLYAFALNITKVYDTYPKRYYFVGRINNELFLMVNAGNVPEVLQDGFNKDDFALSEADLNGAIPVSPESVFS